jgi:hypothetical protein
VVPNRICLIAVGVLVLLGAPAASADPLPEYFNVPTGYTPGGITAAPDGTVWFASNPLASPVPSLGRLNPALAAPGTANGIDTFPTPTLTGAGCCANAVRGVAFDAANNRVWFAQSDGIVGYANAAAVVPGTSTGMVDKLLKTTLQGGGTFAPSLWDIAVGPTGLAWFSEYSTHNLPPYPGGRIASIDGGLAVTESENIALQGGATTLSPTRYDARPAGIAIDAHGAPWFAEADPGLPGYRIARGSGTGYNEYLITPCAPVDPCSGSYTGTGPSDVAVAHDGSVWFTNQLKNQVGRLDAGQSQFSNYSLAAIDAGLANGQPRAISVAPDGTLWIAQDGGFSAPNANAIIRIVPSQPTPTAQVWHLGAGKYPLGVAPDTKGNVWFSLATNTAPSLVGRLAGVVGAGGPGDPGGGGPGGGGKPLTPASVGVAKVGNPSVDKTSLTVNQICVGPPADPCTLVYLIATHEYVTGFPGSKSSSAARKRRKPKPVILGSKTVTLHGGQHKKVTIKLNRKGIKLLKQRGKLKLFFSATQKGAGGKTSKRVKAAKVTFKVKRR